VTGGRHACVLRPSLPGSAELWRIMDEEAIAMPLAHRPLPRAAVSRAWLDVPCKDNNRDQGFRHNQAPPRVP